MRCVGFLDEKKGRRTRRSDGFKTARQGRRYHQKLYEYKEEKTRIIGILEETVREYSIVI